MKLLIRKFDGLDCVRVIIFGCLSSAPASARALGQSNRDRLRNENRRALNVSSATGTSFYTTSLTGDTTSAITEIPSYGPNGISLGI